MTKKAETDYTVKVNGMPNYANIPKAVLEPIENQIQWYDDIAAKNPNWYILKKYIDEGISGTSVNHRVQFLQMIQDAEDGKIDMIVTKSISRFARNTLDCISYVRRLKALKPPVGVFFEMNGYNTLDTTSETFLTLLSTVRNGFSTRN